MKLFNWIKENPIKASLVVLPFVLGCFLLPVDEDWIGWSFLFVVVLGLAFLVFHKHFWVSLLVLSMVTEPVRAVEQPQQLNSWGVPVAVVVVVCAAGYCVYRLGKFCQKKFGTGKPANTNELYSASGGVGDEYGASWNSGSLGSCISEDGTDLLAASESNPATTFSLNVFVTSSASIVTTMSADASDGSWQTWPQFQADVAAHGLVVTGQNDGSKFYERNRQPVGEGEVPISFDSATGTVSVSGGGELVGLIVESSPDLETWTPLLRLRQDVGTGFTILDTSATGQMFYRVLIAP